MQPIWGAARLNRSGRVKPSGLHPVQGDDGRGRSVTATSPDRQPGEESAPGLVFLGPGSDPYGFDLEGHAIGDANRSPGPAPVRPDAELRLLDGERAARPECIGADRDREVHRDVTALTREREHALHVETVR